MQNIQSGPSLIVKVKYTVNDKDDNDQKNPNNKNICHISMLPAILPGAEAESNR